MPSAFGTCSRCGGAYPNGAAFCSRCGQPLGRLADSAPSDAVKGPGASGAIPDWSRQPAGQQYMTSGNVQPQMQRQWRNAPNKSWIRKYWWAVVAASAFALAVIAVLAVIAIPTGGSEEQKAEDAAAKSLIRNAMTAVESSYMDSEDLTTVTSHDLQSIEPSILWPAEFTNNAGSQPAGANTSENQVSVSLDDKNKYEIGTISKSGTEFGVVVDKSAEKTTTYYKGGRAVDSW